MNQTDQNPKHSDESLLAQITTISVFLED